MDAQEEEEIKKEFLLERVVLFSDAVFAIIITIMVIEIKLPEGIREAADHTISHAYKELVPKLIGYTLSFFVIANFWMRHIKICSFLKDYNRGFLALNLLFLFSISLFPFAVSLITGVVSMHSAFYKYGVNIYIGVILFGFLTQAMLIGYLVKNKSQLCIQNSTMDKTLQWKVQKIYFIAIPLLGLVVMLLNYYNIYYLYSMYTVALLGIITAYLKRRYYPSN